ncbi:unnamed protein product [Cuscuta epithymum]|uniref:Scarecrow-like protein 14 n=1 Tax=Cuscuta epithymum TaxID=186058 RepID=A0AAV0CCW3_9ASTE|nr:unnamed protein product [Cuscuta epithymum]CAH9138680.1 unnamed protein product [Cuscuta epithymum]
MSRFSLQLQALSENLSFDSSVTSSNDSSVGTTGFDIDPVKSKSSVASDPLRLSLQSTFSSQTNLNGLNGSLYNLDSANLVPNIFIDDGAASIFQFQRGVEEARRFFPAINPMVIHFDDKYPLDLETEELNSGTDVRFEKDYSADSCRGMKHYRAHESGLDDEKEEGRNKKQSAIYEEDDLSEVFDRVLLCNDDNHDDSPSITGKQSQKGRNGRKSRSNKQGESCEILDPHSLLISCAEFVAAANYSAAVQQLLKIRRYSSPSGVANQRVAHAFANGLEARLAGIGVQLCASSSLHKMNRFPSYACELMKSHMSSSLPFMRLFIFFVNKMIYEVALKATSLHVIDFGILHGVQWPTLIRDLSKRRGGPPKLRITGIELPQSGFRPSQILVDTGCHLARYCKRFNIPFEFNAITAKNWEALKIDDLKLKRGEVIAVNCLDRFKGILDDTTSGADSPRDAVLNLIHEVSPHIFVNSVGSAPRNSPFFVNRFKSALYTYSGVFDMHDSIFSRHDSQMLNFEQAIMGPVITNIIACEGVERIERPETYKQWHSRTLRAGFKPMPLNLELVKELRVKAREAYHKDFMFAEDGHWVLQGWKGQVFSGSSAWVTDNR